jgi:hypothetical protein
MLLGLSSCFRRGCSLPQEKDGLGWVGGGDPDGDGGGRATEALRKGKERDIYRLNLMDRLFSL